MSSCIDARATLAATRHVGRGQDYATPSAAASVAQDGDVVTIEPGTYYDCATWSANRLIVQAAGAGVILTDTACGGKAAFVIRSDDVTVRGLTFMRIRVPDGNGAAIRAEGGAVTLERDRFVNNQVGILAADGADASLSVRECEFRDNAASGDGAADIRAGRIVRLTVQASRFHDVGGGASIGSAATRTEITGNLIEAGKADLAAGIIMITNGGDVLIEDNRIVLADRLPRLGAILVSEDGGAPTTALMLRGNTLVNATGARALLLRHWGRATPTLSDNAVAAGDAEASSEGAALHRGKQWARAAAALLWKVASYVHQRL